MNKLGDNISYKMQLLLYKHPIPNPKTHKKPYYKEPFKAISKKI